MANQAREDWNRLCQLCTEAKLPRPVMEPGGLTNTVAVEIPGYTRRISKTIEEAIWACNLWVYGFQAGYEAALEFPAGDRL